MFLWTPHYGRLLDYSCRYACAEYYKRVSLCGRLLIKVIYNIFYANVPWHHLEGQILNNIYLEYMPNQTINYFFVNISTPAPSMGILSYILRSETTWRFDHEMKWRRIRNNFQALIWIYNTSSEAKIRSKAKNIVVSITVSKLRKIEKQAISAIFSVMFVCIFRFK